MLFTKDAWPGLADGSITLTFRRWSRAQVVAGRSYRSPVGMLLVGAVDIVELRDITDEEARRAGATDRAQLIARLGGPDAGPVHRIEFAFAGPDPLAALRDDLPDDTAQTELLRRLDRLDASAADGPWTVAVLEAIERAPGVVSTALAAALDRDRLAFKRDVRKLKVLGLTESLEVGYRLSPRGAAVLAARRAAPDAPGR